MGERGYETDTKRWKTGDGATNWNDLPYDIGRDSVVLKDQAILNILDYGVTRGSSSSQTVAIKAALDANPGKPFYFPPGDYRLNTQLDVTANNSMILADGARIYAGAAMSVLIDWDNGEASVDDFAQDCAFHGGGILDGNLLADTVLRVSRVIRFELGGGLTIKDPVHRGLVTASPGAEVQAHNIRIHNTGTTNVDDNVGIEATMNDCRFSHISMRDMTIGVWDKGANIWTDIHPWLGTTTQLTARYEDSVGFVIGGNSVLINPYADTYRYSFRSDAAAGYGVARIIAPEVYGNPGNLTNELAALYPGVVFDMADDGGAFSVTNARFVGHPVTPFALVAGESKRLTIRSAGLVASNITGYTGLDDYIRGVPQGNSSFTPTIYGSSTAGTHTYTVQEGRMEVRDGRVSYLFKVKATLDNTISGKLRIGGLPFPVGADSVNVGGGAITYSAGGTGAGAAIGASGSSGPLNAIVTAVDGGMVELLSRAANLTPVTTAEIEATPFQEQLIELWGQIDCTYNYKTW